MNKVRKLPGGACEFHVQGRCIYEERLNPGLNPGLRCRVILEWEKDFEGFLDRAEAFSLNEVQAGALWPRQFSRRMESGVDCPDFAPAEPDCEALPGCFHQASDLCLLALPACEGVCGRYKLRSRPAEDID